MRAVLLSGAVVLLSACASAPPVRITELGFVAPDTWSATDAREGLPPTDWWREFGDPGLDDLIAEAIAGNYDLVAAAARLEQALVRAKIIGADLYPQADLGFGGSRTKRNFVGFGALAGDGGGAGTTVLASTTNSFSLSLDVAWELDVWGRIRSATSGALADAQAALMNRQAAELSLAGQTAKSWFSVIEAREQLALAERTVASYESTTSNVRARYERGVAPALDLRLSLTELSVAYALVQRRARELDASVRTLEVLLGRYPAHRLEATTDLPRPRGAVPAGLPVELLVRRPDLIAAERSLAASGARVREARAALFPRLALTASGGTASEQVDNLIDGDFSVWSVAGNFAQPILQGGRLRAGVDLAVAEQAEAGAVYAGAALQAYAEVETFLAAEGYLAAREEALAEAAGQARAALDLATERYQAGLEDYVTILASQRNALNADSEHLAVRRARLETRVDLYLSLGGGFEGADLIEQYDDDDGDGVAETPGKGAES